ncbi:hypothetical protein L2E82_45653 [Cichorium intybus]|uniref:Uncharacterized protein n=1 Tax=Cichorium intybus TaxID=13427 RepID=A0ACB8ZU50_CICIN|nr:hypothetical protein L2E82_45653 [Cichorium intybus]
MACSKSVYEHTMGRASDKRVVLLQCQLDNERCECKEKEVVIKNLPDQVSRVNINHKDSDTDQEGGTPLSVVRCEKDASIQKSNELATSEKEMETMRSSIIALGILHKSNGKHMLQNKELPKDCYKVSIEKSLVHAACTSGVGNNSFKTVKDAVGGFLA